MPLGSPTFRRFLRYARPYWLWITGSILAGLLKFSLALSLPICVGYIADFVITADVAPEVKSSRLWLAIAGLVAAFTLRMPAAYFRTYLAELAGNRTIFDIREALYAHMQRLSMEYHQRQRSGSTTSRVINDINQSQGILDQGVMSLTVDFIFLVGVVAVLVVWDWQLALVSLSTLPLYALTFGFLNPRLRAKSRDVLAQMSELSGEVNEKLAAQSVVMAFVREHSERIRFFRLNRDYFNKVMRRVGIQVWLISLGEFFTLLGPMIVLSYGSFLVMAGRISLGELLAFYGILSHLYLPMRRLADASAALQVQLAAMDRVFALMDVAPDIIDKPGAKALAVNEGRITFDNVTFAYREDSPVLCCVSFTAEPGQSVAIVGRSGAGKSTLMKLLPRFYDVHDGAISIDGQDIRDVPQHSLRQHIGLVMQDPILFNMSVRENILYGRRNATEQDMLAAARMAHVDEFVNDLPEGYDTIIGERGVTLSGGQKQRVSIARAFLRDPKILVLDEATSNLDSIAEGIIQEALAKLMHGRTTLVIAHRLSTVVDCDKVVVLEDGHKVQEGTHAQLIAQPGVYRALCEEQFGLMRDSTH
jgi:subfamily B ATP-binding cassette protein MsbA